MTTTTRMVLIAAGLLALGACGGKGDDTLGDQARQAADNRTDAMGEATRSAIGTGREAILVNADATRAAGRAREEAIDDADVDSHAMFNAQKFAIVNGN